MRLWLSRGNEVSVRQQLVTQIVLSILSGDLQPGKRLPSTRELARRFRVHPNTISAGYRQLAREKWVEFRKGSGVYVRQETPRHLPGVALDQLIAEFFAAARKLQTPLAVVRARLKQWMDIAPPDHFLLIESDQELAHIITVELRQQLKLPIHSCAPSACTDPTILETAIPLALSTRVASVRPLLPENIELLALHLRSPASSLATYLPVPPTALLAIASRWSPFLKNARTMLLAAGFHADSLLFRDAAKSNWRRGLDDASAVICDRATAEALDGQYRVVTFPLIAEASVTELIEHEQFLHPSVTT